MKILKVFLLFILSATAPFMAGEMQPVKGIAPVADYPVLYINTIDSVPIDQKVTYIDATAWFDASNTPEIETIGSKDQPLILGIRGRGNASWLADGPKPYKMKFDKKQSFFGLTKNKHWVLLPISSHSVYYHNQIGYELGKQMGLPYQPKRFPVQVVLNGVFLGVYMLGENIRVDEGRVDIFEQPDNNEDDSTIPFGWLVEVDNYSDPCQIRIPHQNYPGKYTRITYHTPEELSARQENWLYNQFNGLAEAAHIANNLTREWEEYISIEDIARYFIVQEILHNFDAYLGSWFLYKDKNEEKWHIGPLWDMEWSLDRQKTSLVCEIEDEFRYPNFMDDIIRYPRFRRIAKDVFEEYVERHPSKWIDGFCDSLFREIEPGMEVNRQIWPDLSGRLTDMRSMTQGNFKGNIDYLSSRFATDLFTYDLIVTIEKQEDPDEEIDYIDPNKDAEVFVNGVKIEETAFCKGENMTFTFNSISRRPLKEFIINGQNRTEEIRDGAFELETVKEDLDVKVVFGAATYIPVARLKLDKDSVELLPGESTVVHATPWPEGASDKRVYLKSQNENIAIVDSLGNILGVSPGESIVTATVNDGVMAQCRVKVLEPDITYGDDEATIHERVYMDSVKKTDFKRYVEGLDVSSWIIEDSSIVEIDENCQGEVLKYGETVARAKDRFGRTQAYFELYACPIVYVEYGTGTIYAHHVLYNSRPSLFIATLDEHSIVGLTHDGQPIDEENIDSEGFYTSIHPITENSIINIAVDLTVSSRELSQSSGIRLLVDGRTLRIENAQPGAVVTITDVKGEVKFMERDTTFVFDTPGVYVVSVEGCPNIFKVLISH